jgi:nicotinamidase-related amidase
VTWRTTEQTERWRPAETATVLCDVWDRHWCPAAERRLALLLPMMETVVTALRQTGVQVVHAPSETMTFYAGHPARLRILGATTAPAPVDVPHADPALPIDAKTGGCDVTAAPIGSVWTRQHRAITIDEDSDLVSDNGRELHNWYQQHGIRHILILGVHTNMCILNRTFAIKQMVRWGYQVALIRDLTDTMYCPADPPYVAHERGTELVVSHIEQHWCPTVHSSQLLEACSQLLAE